jgi:hypothetical protein
MFVYYIFMIMLYFIYCLTLFTARIGHCLVHVHLYPNKDRSIVMLTSSIRLCYLLHFKAPEWFQFAGRRLFIAICHLTWISSRKYGTVWYHPASSKLWNLITLSFVNFQGKLTGTSCDLFACEASLFGLLCAWREVQILRQHTFWHAQWDHSRKSRCLISVTLWMLTSRTSLRNSSNN